MYANSRTHILTNTYTAGALPPIQARQVLETIHTCTYIYSPIRIRQALSRQYKRGKYLESSGKFRDQHLTAELANAEKVYDKSELEAENDRIAYMTGEKSTEETEREVQVRSCVCVCPARGGRAEFLLANMFVLRIPL